MHVHLRFCLLAITFLAAPLAAAELEHGFTPVFDGQTLRGWHVSTKTGHSAASKNQSGGRWVVEDGAIVGSQDIKGNGGILVTDASYGDFEIALEMNNDFGPDSGLFLRSTEDGKAWQAMIDYHSGGNLMGIYGEGLGGKPHLRNFSFLKDVEHIQVQEAPVPFPVAPEKWAEFWKHGQWNELRARIVNNPPTITTWINGVKFMEWTEKEMRHAATGGIALQVHGGGDYTKQFVRYRNIRIKKLEAATGGFKTIGVEEFEKLRAQAGVVVLDVRSAEEFAGGHIPGALNLDCNESDFLDKVGKLDKKTTYLVHCAGGFRSAKACQKLNPLQFTSLYNLDGGMKAWEKAGHRPQK